MSALEIIRRRGALAAGLVAERSRDQSVAECGLERMRLLLAALNNPQLAYRTVHIAGSKGKGTTAHASAAMFSAFGYTTGRYTSPHLLEWNERIAVDGNLIPDPAFDRIALTVDQAMNEIESGQSALGTFNAFELLTAIAFVHFRERRCDIAVIEVGLGGRFDSTNHVEPVATVITRIEAEHLETLGPTLRDVAWNKAGVIKSGVPVVLTHQRAEAGAVIEAEVAMIGAPLLRQGAEWFAEATADGVQYRFDAEAPISIRSSIPGAHNAANIGAAVTAVRLATGISPLPEATISRAIADLVIPGRFDRRTDLRTGRELILDGAHTPESIAALVKTVADETGTHVFPVIVSVLSDKPADDILAALAPHAEVVIFPEPTNPRAIPPGDLQERASSLGVSSLAAPSVRAAIDSLPTGSSPVLVTGSFGIVADCLRAISSPSIDPP